MDDPRAHLLEEGQRFSLRFLDATEIQGRAAYVPEDMTGDDNDGHNTATRPGVTVPVGNQLKERAHLPML